MQRNRLTQRGGIPPGDSGVKIGHIAKGLRQVQGKRAGSGRDQSVSLFSQRLAQIAQAAAQVVERLILSGFRPEKLRQPGPIDLLMRMQRQKSQHPLFCTAAETGQREAVLKQFKSAEKAYLQSAGSG